MISAMEEKLSKVYSGNQHIMKRVKIVDLAHSLSLSKGTVSRALNDYPDISESTKVRVRKQAKIMGYVPLSSAQAIKTGRVRALGFILRIDSHDSAHAFLTDFLDGLSRSAGVRNWTLTVATATSDEDELQTFRRLVAERKVDGFILSRSMVNDMRVEMLSAERIPFILYGRTQSEKTYSYFDILGETAMEDAVMRLAKLGHKRIGFIKALYGFNYADLRQQGYIDGLKKANIEFDPELMIEGGLTIERGAEATKLLLNIAKPPTAIVYALDATALGAYQVAQNYKLSIGKDLSIIGYDGISQGHYATPGLSTFKVDTRHAGERLATMLIDQIRGEDIEQLHETVKANFVSRGSDGPPRISSEELAQKISAQKCKTKGEENEY